MEKYELTHYGVKGMKWGVRKARNVHIRGLERKRKKNKTEYIREQIKTQVLPSGSPHDVLRKSKENKRNYKYKDAETAFRIAKQKAKNDPGYKNSPEYLSAAREHGRQKVLKILRDLPTIYRKDV